MTFYLWRMMKMYLQKEISKKNFLLHLEGHWRKKQDPDLLVRGTDPRIRINTKTKCHRSGTLLLTISFCASGRDEEEGDVWGLREGVLHQWQQAEASEALLPCSTLQLGQSNTPTITVCLFARRSATWYFALKEKICEASVTCLGAVQQSNIM